MIAYLLIAVALVINFFGGEVINVFFYGAEDVVGVKRNDHYATAVLDMSVVLAVALGLLACYGQQLKRRRSRHQLHVPESPARSTLGVLLVEFLLVSFGTIALLQVDVSFSADGRGVGQFERSAASALSRSIMVGVFALSVYLSAVKLTWRSALVAGFYAFGSVLSDISAGDRRQMAYVLITTICVLSVRIDRGQLTRFRRNWGRRGATLLGGSIVICGVSFVSYFVRASGVGADFGLLEVAARGTLTSIGHPGILWQIKEYAASGSGLLWGSTIFPFLYTAIIPSALVHIFGGSELVDRGSYRFDSLYNNNPNMGYDFMVLADLYWNFGYFGYVIFIGVVAWVARQVLVHSCREVLFSRAIWPVLVLGFISGLRSDVLFLVKFIVLSYVFVGLFAWLIKVKRVRMV